MTLTDLADVADLLAALGVIASLIYVGYQVKETRKSVRAATAQARTDLGVHLISSRYTSDIAELLVKSVDAPQSLTKADKFKLKSFFSAHVRHCQNLFYLQEQGLLDEYFSYGVARVTTYWIRNYPWAQDEWVEVQKTMPPQFADFINEELERHPSTYSGRDRTAARATLGGEFPHSLSRYARWVPNSTMVHVSAGPPAIPDSRISRLRF